MGEQVAGNLVVRRELDPALHAWLRSGRPILHVEGAPGAGKTSWVKLLAGTPTILDANGEQLAVFAACHFCRRGDARSASFTEFLGSLGKQFARLEPRYAQALVERGRPGQGIALNVQIDARWSVNPSAIGVAIQELVLQASSQAEALNEVMAPLDALLDAPGPAWLVAVDAPDEPSDPGIADLLVALGTMPPRLRWLITSRPNTSFARQLAGRGADLLDLARIAAGSASLASFLRSQSLRLGLLERLAPQLDPAIFLRALGARVQDNFLVAQCATEALAARAGVLDLQAIDDLPSSLSAHFVASLDRLAQPLKDSWVDECGPLLGTLATAKAPIGNADLAACVGLPESRVRDRLWRLRAFLHGGDTGWRLFHATFAEFLLDPSAAQEYWCQESEQHARIIRWIRRAASWREAPDYGLAHLVRHLVAAGGPGMFTEFDNVLTADFLAARQARGGTAQDIAGDFRRMLFAAAAHGAVDRCLMLTVLLALWQDKAGTHASSFSTILLAAMGRVAEASALAMHQEAAGHDNAHSGSSQRAGYATSLVEIGEVEAAIGFARAAAEEGDALPQRAVLDVLAQRGHVRALELLREHPFAGNLPSLSAPACRGLASLPGGVAAAGEVAADEEALVAVAEGCATHDIDQAIALAAAMPAFGAWIGGEHAIHGPRDVIVRVLLSFVQAHPAQWQLAWNYANDKLGDDWPAPYGFLLAAAIVQAAPGLALPAFGKLGFSKHGLHRALAVAWIGRDDPQVFAALAPHVHIPRQPQAAAPAVDGRQEADPGMSGARRLLVDTRRAAHDLEGVLQMVAVIAPEQVHRAGPAFALLQAAGEALLACLRNEPDLPERKARGAAALGRLFGWLGTSHVEQLLAHAEAHWLDEGWRPEFGEGVAGSLAYQGTDCYLQARHDYGGCLLWEGAVRIAGKIIAERDPDDAIRHIDSVETRYSGTRAALIGIAAIAMRRTGRGALDTLPPRLACYTKSATFQDAANTLRQALDTAASVPAGSGTPELAALHEQVRAAIGAADIPFLRVACKRITTLPLDSAYRDSAGILRAEVVRRLLADAMADDDPELALKMMLPCASYDEIRRLAALACARLLPDGMVLVTMSVRVLAFNNGKDKLSPAQTLDLVLAFAAALPPPRRVEFFDQLTSGDDSELREDVDVVLEVHADPEGSVARVAAMGRRSNEAWIHAHLITQLSRRFPETAFPALDTLVEDAGHLAGLLLGVLARSWPIERWPEAVDAYLAWAAQQQERAKSRLTYANGFFDVLLARVGTCDPVAAFDTLDRVAGKFERGMLRADATCEKVITAAAGKAARNALHWPVLARRAGRMENQVARARALDALRAAVAQLAPAAQPGCLALVLAEMGSGPCQPVLQQLESIACSARAVDAQLSFTGTALVARLAGLLQAG